MTTQPFEILQFKLCPHSRSIRLALSERRLEPEMNEELPWEWRPEFLAINPAGSLPVLRLDSGDVLCGAYAISEFLHDTREEPAPGAPRPSQLFPGDPADRAEVRRLVEWFHTKCHLECTSYLLEEKVHARFSDDARSPNSGNLRAARDNLEYHMSYVNLLADQRHYLAGDELSFADFAAAGHISCLDYMDEISWDRFPAAKDWYARIKSRRAFRPLLTDRIPGLAPPMHYTDLDF